MRRGRGRGRDVPTKHAPCPPGKEERFALWKSIGRNGLSVPQPTPLDDLGYLGVKVISCKTQFWRSTWLLEISMKVGVLVLNVIRSVRTCFSVICPETKQQPFSQSRKVRWTVAPVEFWRAIVHWSVSLQPHQRVLRSDPHRPLLHTQQHPQPARRHRTQQPAALRREHAFDLAPPPAPPETPPPPNIVTAPFPATSGGRSQSDDSPPAGIAPHKGSTETAAVPVWPQEKFSLAPLAPGVSYGFWAK